MAGDAWRFNGNVEDRSLGQGSAAAMLANLQARGGDLGAGTSGFVAAAAFRFGAGRGATVAAAGSSDRTTAAACTGNLGTNAQAEQFHGAVGAAANEVRRAGSQGHGGRRPHRTCQRYLAKTTHGFLFTTYIMSNASSFVQAQRV